MERVYRLPPAGFKKLRNRIVFAPVVTLAITVPIMYYFSRQQGSSDFSNNMTLLIVLAVILALVPVRVLRNYRKHRADYFGYTIRLTDREIIREQEGSQPLVLPFTGIIQVIEGKKGSLVIRGINPDEFIIIPAGIEGYEDIAETMRGVVAFSTPETSLLKRYLPSAFSFIMFGLLVSFGQVKNETLFYANGILLLAMLLWSIRYVLLHKVMGRFILLVLAMVTLSVAGLMLSRYTGFIHL